MDKQKVRRVRNDGFAAVASQLEQTKSYKWFLELAREMGDWFVDNMAEQERDQEIYLALRTRERARMLIVPAINELAKEAVLRERLIIELGTCVAAGAVVGVYNAAQTFLYVDDLSHTNDEKISLENTKAAWMIVGGTFDLMLEEAIWKG